LEDTKNSQDLPAAILNMLPNNMAEIKASAIKLIEEYHKADMAAVYQVVNAQRHHRDDAEHDGQRQRSGNQVDIVRIERFMQPTYILMGLALLIVLHYHLLPLLLSVILTYIFITRTNGVIKVGLSEWEESKDM
jgi:hypothetical protein